MDKNIERIILLTLFLCIMIMIKNDYGEAVSNERLLKYIKKEGIRIVNNMKSLKAAVESDNKNKAEPVEEQKNIPPEAPKIVSIRVQKPVALSYKTKKEVYDIRKQYVSKLPFVDENYEPSEDVFGQIIDNKPWISIKSCRMSDSGKANIDGPSMESRYIVNPGLLVAAVYPFYSSYPCDHEKYKRNTEYEEPFAIRYDKEKNEVTVTYRNLIYCLRENSPEWFSLKALNARDLGYKYIYVDKERSTFNFYFKEKVNASNTVTEILDYIHLGSSCAHESGCNNGSPNQPPLNFIYPCCHDKENAYYVKNRNIYIKLWKEKPSSPQQEADIVENIVFKDSWTF